MEIQAGFRPLQCLAPGFLPLEWRHSFFFFFFFFFKFIGILLSYKSNKREVTRTKNRVNYLWELREHDHECEMFYVPWHWQQWTLLLSCLLRNLHGWHYQLIFELGGNHAKGYTGLPPPAFPISFVGLIVCKKMTIVSLFPSPGSPTRY